MGAVNLPILGLAGDEAMLDVETVVAATYPLQSTVYNLGNQLTQGDIFLLTFQMFINATSQPSVITISYGGQESDMTEAQANDMCNAAMKLSSLGTTIVLSSGDSGELTKHHCATDSSLWLTDILAPHLFSTCRCRFFRFNRNVSSVLPRISRGMSLHHFSRCY